MSYILVKFYGLAGTIFFPHYSLFLVLGLGVGNYSFCLTHVINMFTKNAEL